MTLKRILTDDRNLQLIQDNVDSALIPLQNGPLSGGVLLSNISLTSAQDNLISHSLGHVPQFVLTGTPNVQSTIWSPTTSTLNGTNASASQINLRCSTTCTVSVWLT